jgi:hypothetical protein
MMVAMLVAGVALLLAGVLAIVFGLPIQEFSFGNTLILAGAVTACTGAIMLGLSAVVRELRIIARRLGLGQQAETALQSAGGRATSRNQAAEGGGFPFDRDQQAAENAGHAGPAALPASPTPWHDEAASRERARGDALEPAEAAPKPRRNLLFSSSSRKERERVSARTADPSDLDFGPAATPSPPESGEAPPATFDDAWPRPERARAAEAPPQRRSVRAPSTFTETSAGATGPDRYPPVARNEEAPQVTVLKSGIVDGMAYSLYSDGSIEAQLPEGTMRFASIDELRTHLDQRP